RGARGVSQRRFYLERRGCRHDVDDAHQPRGSQFPIPRQVGCLCGSRVDQSGIKSVPITRPGMSASSRVVSLLFFPDTWCSKHCNFLFEPAFLPLYHSPAWALTTRTSAHVCPVL